jgi:hypothetical protein
MRTINQITKENFASSFNLKDILVDSAFYPASGIDGTGIECLSFKTNSFVHVDYSMPRYVVQEALERHFEPVGFRCIGLRYVSKEELTTHGFRPRDFRLNEHEKHRLEEEVIRDRLYSKNFTPFALWAVYEFDKTSPHRAAGQISRFSLLHIGGEACATFEAIYFNNGINPEAVIIKDPSEGYGDNWTSFSNPDFRLYQAILLNHKQNGASMPEYIFSNFTLDDICFWPDYSVVENYIACGCRLFRKNHQ